MLLVDHSWDECIRLWFKFEAAGFPFPLQTGKCIFAISLLSPLEKGMTLYLNKLESPSPKEFGRNWPSPSGENDFKIFAISLLSPLRKGHGLSFEKKLNSPSPKDALCQVWWYWPSGSGEGNENLNKCIWAFSIGELPRFGLSRGVGLFKLSIARGRAGWRTLHVYVAVRLCQNWQTMDCRTMDLSDYRTFGLWSCWTIGLFDYGSSCWTIIGLSDYWAVGL